MPSSRAGTRALGGHMHETGFDTEQATERCPWGQQPISRSEYNSITTKIAEQERARIATVEQTLKDNFAKEQRQATSKAQAEVEKARRESAAQVAKTKREAAAREAAIRQGATKAATAALS